MTKIFAIAINPDAMRNIALLTGSEIAKHANHIRESCIDVRVTAFSLNVAGMRRIHAFGHVRHPFLRN